MHASNPSSPSRHSRCGRVVIVSVLLAALCSSAWAQRKSNSDLTPPARRATTVELATRLAATSEIPRLPAKSVNPFSPASWDAPDPDEQRLAFDAAENARRAGLATQSRPQRSPLASVANAIQPSGVVLLGGQPTLLIRGRRVRVGDALSATFEGRAYTVTITAITRDSFTLRMNGEELTRPIKSGTKP
jgi:hypothetical protein